MSTLTPEQTIAVQIIGDLNSRFSSFVVPNTPAEKMGFISLWVDTGKDYDIFGSSTYKLYLDFVTNFWGYSTPPSSRQVFEWISAALNKREVVIFARNLKSRYGSGWRNDSGFEYNLYLALKERGLLDLDYDKLLSNIVNQPSFTTFSPNVNQIVSTALLLKHSDIAPIIQKTFRKALDQNSELYNNPLIAETRRRIGSNVIKYTQESALKKLFLDTYYSVLLDYDSGAFKPKLQSETEKINPETEERRKEVSFILSLKK